MDEIDCASERTESFNTAAIQAVLSRLAGPRSTGVCKSCYDQIETERLLVNPTARHCSHCATEEEVRIQRARRCGPR